MYVLPTITREKSIRSQNQVLLDDRLEIAETPNLVKRPVCLQHMRLPIPNPGCGVQIQTVSFCASQSVIIDAINFIDKLRMTLNSLYLVNLDNSSPLGSTLTRALVSNSLLNLGVVFRVDAKINGDEDCKNNYKRDVLSLYLFALGLGLILPKRETINPVTTTSSTGTIKSQHATLIPHRHTKSLSLLEHRIPISTFPYTNISNFFKIK
jgi:hypothetical protein